MQAGWHWGGGWETDERCGVGPSSVQFYSPWLGALEKEAGGWFTAMD